MKRMISILFIATVVSQFSAYAANESNPKQVEVQGTVDVNVVNSASLPVELAPEQQVTVPETVFDPSDILLVQSFVGSDSTASKLVKIPKTMILRTITIVPSSIDPDPNLFNCGAIVRWPSENNPTDPASTDRIIVDHNWKGTNHISLNYAMPYNVRLPQGAQIETSVGRVGSSGFCEAIFILTGTTVTP